MPRSRNIPSRTRVGGSGFTVFMWGSDPIGFARQISHTSPTPVGAGPTPIHPMDEKYALEIITPAAQNPGSLVLELYELYNQKVWDNLSFLAGSTDLVEIFIRVAASDTPITVTKVIYPPSLGGAPSTALQPYAERYHRCVITNVEDGETIEVGTMEITKRITIAYTHMTRDGSTPSFSTNPDNGLDNLSPG